MKKPQKRTSQLVVAKRVSKGFDIQLAEPTIPKQWDYDASIKYVASRIYKWGNLTVGIANELRMAREILSLKPALRPRNASGAFAPMDKNWKTYCRDIGNDKSTVNRWLKAWQEDWYQSSQSIEWETPQWLFDLLNEEFHFETDVCATAKNAKCKHYFSKKQNGLNQDWAGVCWMNPPYGREIAEWMSKARESAEKGATVVCLVPARPDTDWWWENALEGEIRFLRGRLKFANSTSSSTFPSAVVVLKPNATKGKVIWWDVNNE